MDIRKNADYILALQEAKSNMDEMRETCGLIAKINRNYYDALIRGGFTEEQALVLVSKQGLNLNSKE